MGSLLAFDGRSAIFPHILPGTHQLKLAQPASILHLPEFLRPRSSGFRSWDDLGSKCRPGPGKCARGCTTYTAWYLNTCPTSDQAWPMEASGQRHYKKSCRLPRLASAACGGKHIIVNASQENNVLCIKIISSRFMKIA